MTITNNKLSGAFGTQAVTFAGHPAGRGARASSSSGVSSRRGARFGPMMKLNLPFLDYIMTRKQLRNMKKLAEKQVAAG